MEKLILTNGSAKMVISIEGDASEYFERLLQSIKGKEQVKQYEKPEGDYLRYEHINEKGELIQCSFWFKL